MLAVWSASPAPGLEGALREVFGNAEEQRHAAPGHGRVGGYFLYSAHR